METIIYEYKNPKFIYESFYKKSQPFIYGYGDCECEIRQISKSLMDKTLFIERLHYNSNRLINISKSKIDQITKMYNDPNPLTYTEECWSRNFQKLLNKVHLHLCIRDEKAYRKNAIVEELDVLDNFNIYDDLDKNHITEDEYNNIFISYSNETEYILNVFDERYYKYYIVNKLYDEMFNFIFTDVNFSDLKDFLIIHKDGNEIFLYFASETNHYGIIMSTT